MPAFSDETGRTVVHVIGIDGLVALVFARVPETVIAAMAGRRAFEIIGHSAFAPGARNGATVVVEAVGAQRPGGDVAGVAIGFGRALDLAEARR